MTVEKKTAFEKDQFDLAYPPGVEAHYWQKARARIILRELKKAGLIQKKMLEIGCGKGAVVKTLLKSGLNIVGVELAAIDAYKEVKDKVITGKDAIELDAQLRNSIEVILLLDVIEHIEQPAEFIHNILKYYPNVNHILVTVPARQELWSNYDEFYGHYRRYDREGLNKLASVMKWTLITSGYLFHGLYLPAKLSMYMNKKREVKINAPTGPLKIVHKLLAAAFFLDFVLLPGSLYGSSLMGILRR